MRGASYPTYSIRFLPKSYALFRCGSVDFAQVVLRQLYNKISRSFFDHVALSKAHVLELGYALPISPLLTAETELISVFVNSAGTGLLGIVFSPYVRHYTSTDIAELVPLISKNIAKNLPFTRSSPAKKKGTSQTTAANVTAIALDWLELLAASAPIRPKLIPADPVDLLLVVDCIYHPSLLPALLATMDYLTVPGRTVVVVVVELRAEDVVREFLKGWLDMVEVKRWEIWSVAGLVDGPYAVWVGWKGVT